MVRPDSSHGLSRVVHHKDFYLRGGDMTVLVENHLYRIHSYFFERESLFFRNKFNSSNAGDNEERGSTDSNAYTLEDVKSEDFARFLWVFYNPKYSVYEAPLDTWLSILKLANRWTFDNVKELAVSELEKIEIEAVEKISIYHDNSISRLYLVPSYIAICKRDKPLTFSEGMRLGMETVLRIAEARERLRLQASESGIRTPTFEDFEDEEVEVLIREIFCLGTRSVSHSPASPHANGVNGVNGTIKLNPAPPGNPPKPNGTRANGVSAADPKPSSSVNSMPSFALAMGQGSATTTPEAPQQQTGAQQTAQHDRPPVPPVKTDPAPSSSQVPSPPSASDKSKDKGKDKDTALQPPSSATVMSPKTTIGGVGEPLSSLDSIQGAGSRDVTVSKPSVVPSSEHSNDVSAESNDNVNDAEKDDPTKDFDIISTASDAEGPKTAGRGKNKKRGTASLRGSAKK